MSFLHPHAGWLLLALPLFWWWSRGAPRVGRWLRLAALACVLLGLTGPSLLVPEGSPPQVIVVDQQAELAATQRERAATLVRQLLAQRPSAVLLQRGGAPLALGLPDGRHVVLGGAQAASLSQSVEHALALLPAQGGAITVVGERRAADAHWERVAEALRRRQVVLNLLELPPAARPPVIVAAQAAPARAGEAVQMHVEVEGAGQDLVLSASSAGRELARSAPFALQGRQGVALRLPGQSPGFVPVTLALRAAGGTADGFDTEIAVQPPRRLLYVQGVPRPDAAPLQALLGRSFDVQAMSAARLGAFRELAAQDVVVLDDVPAEQMTDGLQTRLLQAVREQGLGLFFSGGEQAFADGRYGDRPLAEALPVRLQPQQRHEEPTVAVAIVVDTSGSMLGRPLQLAKQVARLAVRRLQPTDSVGVVEFYGGRQWVAPMQPARHLPDVERAISRLQAQGATEMLYAAMEEAYYGLKNTPARYKHLVVLSDGGVEADRYQQLIRHIAQERVSVSAVLVGSDPVGEATMSLWARLGRGRFYAVRDEFSTVELDFRQPQQKPEPGYHRGAVALDPQAAPPWWRDVSHMPPELAGYASTLARPEADTWLRTAQGEPLMSSWQYGAGRVTAWMTEPLGAGTQPWRAWPDYGQWLARALGVTAAASPRVCVTLHRRFDRLAVEVRTQGEVPQARLLGAEAPGTGALALQAMAPGLFVAELPFDAARTARVEGTVGADVARAVDPAGSDMLPAARWSEARAQPLLQLVQDSAGRHVPGGATASSLADLPAGRAGADWTARALWPMLAGAALLLYLIDLLHRRWPRRRLPA
ncbi:VWA domain-containing protein [Roseateles cellulosilyticus]|uniref:VWA domain-containing protein n=1 Tax=Pelomonas cellulosilytica TaxID=2906762 RepID=A0ABS8XZA8_9BURK|nr:VWA domain-containing protein [Pelomonas sp. P8]MCE4557944.1 VWA domain-containing protein [Pelomonas sp. P8]